MRLGRAGDGSPSSPGSLYRGENCPICVSAAHTHMGVPYAYGARDLPHMRTGKNTHTVHNNANTSGIGIRLTSVIQRYSRHLPLLLNHL